MKFTTLITLLSLILPLLANPITTESELEKREDCIVLDGGKFYGGRCVDVKKGKQCEGGLLVTGWCGGGNTNICCVKGFLIGKPKAKTGLGDAP